MDIAALAAPLPALSLCSGAQGELVTPRCSSNALGWRPGGSLGECFRIRVQEVSQFPDVLRDPAIAMQQLVLCAHYKDVVACLEGYSTLALMGLQIRRFAGLWYDDQDRLLEMFWPTPNCEAGVCQFDEDIEAQRLSNDLLQVDPCYMVRTWGREARTGG